MRTFLILCAVLVLCTGCDDRRRIEMDRAYPGLAPEDEFVTNVAVRGGVRYMTDELWEGLDEQLTLGAAWDTRMEGWPVAVAGSVDYHQADADDDRGDAYDVDTWEFALGAQRTEIFGGGFLASYGLGGTYQRVVLEGPSSYRDLDWAVGGYGQAGVGYLVSGWCIVELTARYSETTMMDFSRSTRKIRGGAMQLMGTLGVRF